MDRKTEGQEIGTTQKNSSKTRIELGIVYRRIDDLKPDPANPRRHTRKQVRQIAESIKAFGFNVPILIDRYGNIIAGHGRWLAGRELGITEVPTLCLDHLTPAQARAFMIADNRLTEISVWDDQLLARQLKELSLVGLDFDIEVTGFEMGEIDLRIASLDDPAQTEADPADVVPEIPAIPLSKLAAAAMASSVTRCCRSAASVAEMAKPEPDLPEASLVRVEQRLPAARPHFVRDLVGRALLLRKREKKASRGHRRGQCRSRWPMPGRRRRSPEVRIAPEPAPSRCATGRLSDRTVCPVAPHKRRARAILASPPTCPA